MAKYVPGIMGEKSSYAKNFKHLEKERGMKYKKAPNYKPTGKALALANKIKR